METYRRGTHDPFSRPELAMSVPARLLFVPPRRARFALPGLGWAITASFIGLLEAVAAYLDPKLGFMVAVALIATVIVLSRPTLLLPIAVATVFLEGLTFSGAAVTRLLAPGALALVIGEVLRGTGRLRLGAPLAWASAYVLWAISSALWTESLPGTQFLLQSLAIALVFMAAFTALVNTEEDLRRLLYVLAFVSSFIGGLSVLAFAGFFGEEAEMIPHLGLLQAGRSQGGVGDPDFFAAMQIVSVPLVMVLATQAKDRRMRIVLYAGVLTLLTSIFTSLSRGGFIGLVLLGLLLLASNPERLFRSRREKSMALLVVAVGMVAFFSRPFVRDQVGTRVQSIYAPKNKEDTTGSGRTNIWKAAARTAQENPVLGIGYGSFKYVSEELIYHTPGVDLEVYGGREEGDNFAAHNTYLGTAAEIGITGLLLYIGVILSTGMALRRTAARAFAAGKPFVGRTAHALLVGLAGWTFATFFLSAETARMFWIIVGLSLALPKLLPEWEPVRWQVRTPSVRSRATGPEPIAPPATQAPAPAPPLVQPQPAFAYALPESRPLPPPARVEPRVFREPQSAETVEAAPRSRRWLSADRIVQACSALGLLWALGLLALILLR
jgi:putative inorganic carbon (HCO3(-)) transporter